VAGVTSPVTLSIVPDGVLAYGIQLPVQALSTRVSMEWERERGSVNDMVRVAQACDDAGFLYVAACHHVAIPREPAELMSTTWFDPVATLAFLAALTKRTRLMTNVYVAAYRHPLETAKAFATVDALSGGRLLFGVGAGHVEGEFEALSIPFAERGAITDESIDAILGAWEDEWAPHTGPRWKWSDVGQRPRPVQQPHPPIWIGGSGKPALRRVARVGDGWIPQATPPDRLADDIAYILRERDKVRPGAVPEVGYHAGVYVGKPAWELPKFAMNGNDRIIDWINRLGAQGVSHVQVRFAARSADELCEQVTRFGAEIGPHLTRVALS
jgi:probable F420-dependent oxidoreductase